MRNAITVLLFIFGATALSNCGRASKASISAHAESIGGPPGVQCYAIVSGDTVVGGNCIKN